MLEREECTQIPSHIHSRQDPYGSDLSLDSYRPSGYPQPVSPYTPASNPRTVPRFVGHESQDYHKGDGAVEIMVIMAACHKEDNVLLTGVIGIFNNRTVTMPKLKITYWTSNTVYNLQQLSNPRIYIVWGAELS